MAASTTTLQTADPARPRHLTLGLRGAILLLALAVALPLLLALGYAWQLQEQQQAQARHQLLRSRAHATAEAVFNRLRQATALARLGDAWLREDPAPGAGDRLARMLRTQRDVSGLLLLDGEGKPLLEATHAGATAHGDLRPCFAGPAADDRSDAPVAMAVPSGSGSGEAAWTAAVPHPLRHPARCELRSLMSMTIIGEVLRRERWPAGWIVAIVDADFRIVARSRQPEDFVGLVATPHLQDAIRARADAVFEGVSRDGTPVLAYTAPVTGTQGWHIAVGVSRAAVDAELDLATPAFLLACAAALAFACLLGLLLAGRIAAEVRSISGLHDRGRADKLRIREVAQAAARLAAAREARLASEAARTATIGELERENRRRTQGERLLKAMQTKLLRAEESERRRLARELHDQLGQELALMQLWLHTLLAGVPPPRREQLLRDCCALAESLTDRTRSLALDLRPAQLDDLGLAAALQALGRRVGRQEGLAVEVVVPDSGERLADDVETALFRIAQTAVTNVLRHAGATQLRIVLDLTGDTARLAVEDNGAGFDLIEALEEAAGGAGMGLLVMQERVEMLGGTMEIATQGGQGTRIAVSVPLAGRKAAG